MIIHFPLSVEKLIQWIEEEHIPAGTHPIVTDLEGVEEAAVSWNVNFFLNIFPKEFKLTFFPWLCYSGRASPYGLLLRSLLQTPVCFTIS